MLFGKVLKMKELNFDSYATAVASKDKPSVVMVKASWCSNCKAMAPVFENTANELEEEADFFYLTVDDNEQLARSLKIMGVPTLLFYRHGTLIYKKIGKQSANAIAKSIESLISLSDVEAKDKEYRSLFRRLFGKK